MHSIGDFIWSVTQQRSMSERPQKSGRPADRRAPVNGSQGRSIWAGPKGSEGWGGQVIRGSQKVNPNDAHSAAMKAKIASGSNAVGIPPGGKWKRPFI